MLKRSLSALVGVVFLIAVGDANAIDRCPPGVRCAVPVYSGYVAGTWSSGGGHDNSHYHSYGSSGYVRSSTWGYDSGTLRDVGSSRIPYCVPGGSGVRTETWDNFQGRRTDYQHNSGYSYGSSHGHWHNGGGFQLNR